MLIKINAFIAELALPYAQITPVSYTHLDVYKRQDVYSKKIASNNSDPFGHIINGVFHTVHDSWRPCISYACLLYTSRCV